MTKSIRFAGVSPEQDHTVFMTAAIDQQGKLVLVATKAVTPFQEPQPEPETEPESDVSDDS